MFSNRLPATMASNRLCQALAAHTAGAEPLLDLTVSNPTTAGLAYPADLLAELSNPAALHYTPHPAGLLCAREAIAADYQRHQRCIAPDEIRLTASTSEAYSFLFKLLADPGSEVLVPRPSYPLFEHLARLEGVQTAYYDLDYYGDWSINFSSLKEQLTPATRALLLVQPNNPTGSCVAQQELEELAQLCQRYQTTIISDEVFADYPLTCATTATVGDVLRLDGLLTFILGGLSKSIGLPQAKLGWLVAGGSASLRKAALEQLDYICDTYLSVSTPVQVAAPALLQHGAAVRDQIRQRIAANLATANDLVAAHPWCTLLRPAGGWSLPLRFPDLLDEEEVALQLLTAEHVVAHPGYFFDFPTRGILVLSLLTPCATFESGLQRIMCYYKGLLQEITS